MGASVEVALSRRVNVAYDGAITEGRTQKLADGVYKWSGLNYVTDFQRMLSAVHAGGALRGSDADRRLSLAFGANWPRVGSPLLTCGAPLQKPSRSRGLLACCLT